MIEDALKKAMNGLYEELTKSDNQKSDKTIIAKAVQLGIQYEKERLKDEILKLFDNKK